MGIETERKYLVRNDSWRKLVQTGVLIRQGYLCRTAEYTSVRVRRMGDAAFLTVKSPRQSISRLEYEYTIPAAEADQMLELLCRKPLVEKYRYCIPAENGLCWEIDEFLGVNAGLVLAEIELPDADMEIILPDWIGEDVSTDPRYFNSNLNGQ